MKFFMHTIEVKEQIFPIILDQRYILMLLRYRSLIIVCQIEVKNVLVRHGTLFLKKTNTRFLGGQANIATSSVTNGTTNSVPAPGPVISSSNRVTQPISQAPQQIAQTSNAFPQQPVSTSFTSASAPISSSSSIPQTIQSRITETLPNPTPFSYNSLPTIAQTSSSSAGKSSLPTPVNTNNTQDISLNSSNDSSFLGKGLVTNTFTPYASRSEEQNFSPEIFNKNQHRVPPMPSLFSSNKPSTTTPKIITEVYDDEDEETQFPFPKEKEPPVSKPFLSSKTNTKQDTNDYSEFSYEVPEPLDYQYDYQYDSFPEPHIDDIFPMEVDTYMPNDQLEVFPPYQTTTTTNTAAPAHIVLDNEDEDTRLETLPFASSAKPSTMLVTNSKITTTTTKTIAADPPAPFYSLLDLISSNKSYPPAAHISSNAQAPEPEESQSYRMTPEISLHYQDDFDTFPPPEEDEEEDGDNFIDRRISAKAFSPPRALSPIIPVAPAPSSSSTMGIRKTDNQTRKNSIPSRNTRQEAFHLSTLSTLSRRVSSEFWMTEDKEEEDNENDLDVIIWTRGFFRKIRRVDLVDGIQKEEIESVVVDFDDGSDCLPALIPKSLCQSLLSSLNTSSLSLSSSSSLESSLQRWKYIHGIFSCRRLTSKEIQQEREKRRRDQDREKEEEEEVERSGRYGMDDSFNAIPPRNQSKESKETDFPKILLLEEFQTNRPSSSSSRNEMLEFCHTLLD